MSPIVKIYKQQNFQLTNQKRLRAMMITDQQNACNHKQVVGPYTDEQCLMVYPENMRHKCGTFLCMSNLEYLNQRHGRTSKFLY